MLATRRSRQVNRQIRINRGMIAETGTIPDGLQLIKSTAPFIIRESKKVVSEDLQGRKVNVMRVTGLFQEANKQNANGRVYPFNVLAPAVQTIQEDVANRAVLGEFDHPPDAKIHLDRVSHLITKIWMEGNRVFGEAEVLDNQVHGAALYGLFERKCRTGISSRGIGDMEVRESRDGGEQIYEVMPGYAFVTWDAVAEPSVHGATLNVMEHLKKKLDPIREQRAQRRSKPNGVSNLSPRMYEDLLVKEVRLFFAS